ncbi:MAG TPA: primosomal protein N' [Pseudoclavibacter sp.]|nr:primosomal protein N' [Pseudoclavibacter sp.]
MSETVAQVAIVSPLATLDRLFDYRIPDRLREQAVPGVRVRVRFGSRKSLMDGFIVTCGEATDPTWELQDIDKVVSAVPVLSAQVWALARRIADRQAGVASDVLRLAIPPRHARTENAWWSAHGRQLPPQDEATETGKTGKDPQRTALLVRAGGQSRSVDGISRWYPLWVLDVLRRALAYSARGEQLLVLVPDHRDAGFLVSCLDGLGGQLRILRMDASADAAARYEAFLTARAGEADVIVGTRQAVYAPADRLGGIYLWQDADPSFSEPHAPYAHARDVALVRQALTGCDLVFASTSRSTAVQRLVEVGFAQPEVLGVPATVIPSGSIIGADQAPHPGLPEAAWRMASDVLARDGQVLIQSARRGYARMLLCGTCRTPARCASCGGPLGVAVEGAPWSCRWCGRQAMGYRCPVCGDGTLRFASPGVERTSRDVGLAFPRARIVTSTGDTPIDRVTPGRAVVLSTPGVEPLAEQGGYDLVILLDCARMLLHEHLSTVEDAVRHWFAAASLVAVGGTVLAVGVEGRLAQALRLWRPEVFAADELQERRAAGFPPARRICAVTGPVGATRHTVDLAGVGADVTIIGTVPWDAPGSDPHRSGDGLHERTLLTVSYARGEQVARALKAAAMQAAHHFREWGVPRQPGQSAPVRIRFDDVDSL